MANYILQELPKGMADGKKVLYPKMQTYNLHDFDTVLKNMKAYSGSFSEGTMRGVIDALVTTMTHWMPLGHNIKIDGLGVFSLSLGFDTTTPSEKGIAKKKNKGKVQEAEEEKEKYRHVCIKGLNFKPDPELLANLNREATFDRVQAEVKKPQKCMYSREERLALAKSIIEKQGFMSLTDYVCSTEQSRTSASRDLRSFVADPASGITTRGSHSHKVWVVG